MKRFMPMDCVIRERVPQRHAAGLQLDMRDSALAISVKHMVPAVEKHFIPWS